MSRYVLGVLVLASLSMASMFALAQDPGKIEMELVERLATLIGAPVFAADGEQIGEVADVWMAAEG